MGELSKMTAFVSSALTEYLAISKAFVPSLTFSKAQKKHATTSC